MAVPTAGPLRVHATNPRYFADRHGKAVYLTGSHTWDTLQDLGEADPPPAFDFDAHLDFLVARGHDFIRLWRWELFRWDTGANQKEMAKELVAAPHPWLRTGPGLALDGKPRFNLRQYDPEFFTRLRTRVQAAGRRGIYVSVMLFEGWGLRFVEGGWQAHPFHPANRLPLGAGEPTGPVDGKNLFTLDSPVLNALQEAYVRQVVETLNDLDNVLYEIANESDFATTQWQYHLIRQLKAYEAGMAQQHPVGMTSIGYGVDDLGRLLDSPADWISPNPDGFDYKNDPPAATGAKVMLPDTDHLWGVGGSVQWVWKSFTRGLNPIFMDPYRREVLDMGDEAEWERCRRALGFTRRLAEEVGMDRMVPGPELASSGYCLAEPGRTYVVYLPEGGEVRVDLSVVQGRVRVTWRDPRTGETSGSGEAQGGGWVALPAPGAGDAVLLLRAL
ncbi:MAG: hypothetical protein IT369_02490 [Candidatus Latescibacteria bacterium]|nr:hypothetical protein [Candidatus Latescibacterota bacterium]